MPRSRPFVSLESGLSPRISQPNSSACCGGDVGTVLRGNEEPGVALWVTFCSPQPHFGNLVSFHKPLRWFARAGQKPCSNSSPNLFMAGL